MAIVVQRLYDLVYFVIYRLMHNKCNYHRCNNRSNNSGRRLLGSSQPVIKTVTYATIAETIISHILDKRKFLTKLILEIRLY